MMRPPSNKEFPRIGDVDRNVAVHGVFAEHVDAEFPARFSKAPLAIQRNHVGEHSPAYVVVDEFEKLLRELE